MNIYLIIILIIIFLKYLLSTIVEILNTSNLSTEISEEFTDYYPKEKYAKAQQYLRDNSRLGLIHSTFYTISVIVFILLGGFNFIDNLVRDFNFNETTSGLLYILVLTTIYFFANLPFKIFDTFVVEEKYGFNKTTIKTFIFDIVKNFILLIIIGGPLLAAIIWFFSQTGKLAPLYLWIMLTSFQLFMIFIAPITIMPLFNKFTPLKNNELNQAIKSYTQQHGFKMKGVYQMDGSKRSTKSNAFFTGFGKYRRIVLFDTLIEKHSVDELVSILAHEVGHYRLKHIFKMMFASFIETGLMLFILSIFINNKELFQAFRMEELSIYASLVFFGFLYSPLSLLLSLAMKYLSRQHEYQADEYAVKTTGKAEIFITALKKLSVDNLSNLTPHPLKVFLSYTHPPVLIRIKTIKKSVKY